MTNTTPRPVDANSLFVVSGGARGITANCVVGMARRFHCGFILLGRSAAGEPPAFVAECPDEPALMQRIAQELAARGEKATPAVIRRELGTIQAQREIAQTLAEIRAAGGRAEYLSVDIADADALRSTLADAQARLGTITGLFHGAGVLADRRIEQKRAADFDAVFTPKIVGLRNLLACLAPADLHHLILFSSAAGFYGNPGQSDYAMANEILNRVAHLIQRDAPACHTVALNWGPWDAGMVTPALKTLFAERGIQVIPLEAGVARLVDELEFRAERPAQVLVGSPLAPPPEPYTGPLRTWRIHRKLTLEDNPFLQDHMIGIHAVLPATCGMAWMIHGCEQLLPGYHFARAENYQVLKGVVFDESLAPEYLLTIRETERDAAAGTLTLEATVSSEGEKRPRYHYRARLILRHGRRAAAPRLEQMDLRERQPTPGAEFYAKGTLFHGPRFRGVEQVLSSDANGLTMRCRMPEVSDRDQGQFPVRSFDPYLADVQFQSLVIWAWQHHGAASLPLSNAVGELYASPQPGATFYVTMKVRSDSEYRMLADLIAHDADGRIYLRLEGAEVAISQHLNRLFNPAAA
ncbi:MAG: SDR family NAD(P)-dependent oxidoreductase [Candidatus Viridilinea halotolerans]|uniref:SDR family NAD(P)-dependent oxidoreductase n=1 Tax=Candidatus Viridilinea halotolerans TaxID=2491704 RepID=A0A426TS40_9CHLR|nr:MAG: SDR family NAD(P)-dependent oxidoreductase [Candidatus Viridilinea halotolerans]